MNETKAIVISEDNELLYGPAAKTEARRWLASQSKLTAVLIDDRGNYEMIGLAIVVNGDNEVLFGPAPELEARRWLCSRSDLTTGCYSILPC